MKGGAGVASRNKVTGLSRAWPLRQIVTVRQPEARAAAFARMLR